MNNKSRNVESLLDTVVSSKMLIGYLGFCNRLGSAICSKCLTPKFSSSVPLSSPFNSNIKIANFLTVSQPWLWGLFYEKGVFCFQTTFRSSTRLQRVLNE